MNIAPYVLSLLEKLPVMKARRWEINRLEKNNAALTREIWRAERRRVAFEATTAFCDDLHHRGRDGCQAPPIPKEQPVETPPTDNLPVVKGQVAVMAECPHCEEWMDLLHDEMIGEDHAKDTLFKLVVFGAPKELPTDAWKDLGLKYGCGGCGQWFMVDSL